jgi:hypothetical protein
VSFAEVPSIVPQSPEEEDGPDGDEAESEEEDDIQDKDDIRDKDDSPSSASSDRCSVDKYIRKVYRTLSVYASSFVSWVTLKSVYYYSENRGSTFCE